MNKELKLKIQSGVDRDNMVIALVNAGYRVRVEVENDLIAGNTYYVVFNAKITKEDE